MSDLDDTRSWTPFLSPAGRTRITPHALHGALEQDELAVKKMSKLFTARVITPHNPYRMGFKRRLCNVKCQVASEECLLATEGLSLSERVRKMD